MYGIMIQCNTSDETSDFMHWSVQKIYLIVRLGQSDKAFDQFSGLRFLL